MTAPARLLALFLLAMLILGTLMLISGMAFIGSFVPTYTGLRVSYSRLGELTRECLQ